MSLTALLRRVTKSLNAPQRTPKKSSSAMRRHYGRLQKCVSADCLRTRETLDLESIFEDLAQLSLATRPTTQYGRITRHQRRGPSIGSPSRSALRKAKSMSIMSNARPACDPSKSDDDWMSDAGSMTSSSVKSNNSFLKRLSRKIKNAVYPLKPARSAPAYPQLDLSALQSAWPTVTFPPSAPPSIDRWNRTGSIDTISDCGNDSLYSASRRSPSAKYSYDELMQAAIPVEQLQVKHLERHLVEEDLLEFIGIPQCFLEHIDEAELHDRKLSAFLTEEQYVMRRKLVEAESWRGSMSQEQLALYDLDLSQRKSQIQLKMEQERRIESQWFRQHGRYLD